MSLTVVSTPMGNIKDITLRAIETLKNCDVIICEEIKPATQLLKHLEIKWTQRQKPDSETKEIYQLNEHSTDKDIIELRDLCEKLKVALISDCGTPGFCDPGAKLVEACRKLNIPVTTNPGPSSLMALLSLCGEEYGEFYFAGFIPAEKSKRQNKIQELSKLKIPFVVMDTPYRLKTTLEELALVFPNRQGVLGVDITGTEEQIYKESLRSLANKNWEKAPFILMVL